MFGKHFASMYTGSMVGAGSPAFAVMGYVIANMRPDKQVGAQVELNPKLLAFIIGDDEETIVKAIEFLCSPDRESRTPAESGRRLIKIGTYDYRVVNGAKYLAIRDEETRRESNREAKRRQRNKTQVNGSPGARERQQIKELENGERTEDQLGAEI